MDEGGGEALVFGEQEFDAFAFRGEGLFAKGGVHGFVEGLMRLEQGGGHGERIIEVGQRVAGKLGASVQNGLRFFLDVFYLRRRRISRPREIVVNKGVGIAIVAFKPPAYIPHPFHVHERGEDAEMVKGGVGDNKTKIAGDNLRAIHVDRYINAPF